MDEKKISWKDVVRDHIPEFKMYNDYVTENFMIEDLLCHRSGLGLGAGDLMDFPGGGALMSAVQQTIVDSYLELDDFGWVDKYSKQFAAYSATSDAGTAKVWETVAAAKNTKINTADYIGIYEDKWFGMVEVFLKGDQLWFKKELHLLFNRMLSELCQKNQL